MGRIPTKIEGNGSPVTHLWERHKEIARLDVAGVQPVEISRRLNITQSWLSTIQCSPVYRKYRDSLSARADEQSINIKQKIQEGAEVGVLELLKVLKGEGVYKDNVPVSQKIKVAQDFLDREGHGKITKVQEERTVTVLDGTRIEELKQKRALFLAGLKPISHVEGQSCSSPSETVIEI